MQPLTAEQRRLVEENLGVAHAIAGRFIREGRAAGLSYDDLVSLACVGLCRGARLYDPAIAKPSTYFWRCCTTRVQRGVMHEHRAHGRDANFSVVSLDQAIPVTDEGDSDNAAKSANMYFFVADPSADVETEAVEKRYAEQVADYAFTLGRTERDRRIIKQWLKGCTLREIAEREGLSMQAVHQKTARYRKRIIAKYGEEETQ